LKRVKTAKNERKTAEIDAISCKLIKKSRFFPHFLTRAAFAFFYNLSAIFPRREMLRLKANVGHLLPVKRSHSKVYNRLEAVHSWLARDRLNMTQGGNSGSKRRLFAYGRKTDFVRNTDLGVVRSGA
jgi:hypothetical protein